MSKEKYKMVGKRRLLKLIEDNGGISSRIVYKAIIDGNKAEKEYREKFNWEEHRREN